MGGDVTTWKRPEEFARLLEELDGNDFWELANNEGSEQANRLCDALDLLERAAARLTFDPADPDGAALARLFAWAQTATGYGDEAEGT